MHTLTMRQGRRLHLPSRGMAFLLAASLPLLPASTMAQSAVDDGEENFAIEEVIVTAQRREQGLMDVPVAVTAFTGEQLERMGALDIIALTQTTPNTTLEVSRGTNSTLTAFIRGVGQQDPVAGFESGVGIYVDDVYFNRPQAAVLEIFDVERIEILRGPQGTLYGRNTIGGAIKYVTRRLSDGPELKARGRYGNYNMLDLVVTGSLPLSDNFRIGGSVASLNRDGFGDNLNLPGIENYNKDMLGARFSAEWEPGEECGEKICLSSSGDFTCSLLCPVGSERSSCTDEASAMFCPRILPGGMSITPQRAECVDTKGNPACGGGLSCPFGPDGGGISLP